VCDERGVGAGRSGSVVLALVLALAQAVLLASIAWDKSDTADESQYLAAAATLWANGDVSYLCGAPALPRWGTALALAAVDGAAVAATPRAEPIRYVTAPRAPERLRAVLFAARVPTMLVVVLGGLLLWSAARRFGARAAFVTQALWCLSPTVLANGSLAALDAWLAAAMCAVVWSWQREYERPTVAHAVVVGAACAAAATCKMTGLGVLPLAVYVMLGRAWRAGRWRLLASASLAFAIGVWAVYGFSVGTVHVDTPCNAAPLGLSIGPLPAPAWIEGMVFQLHHRVVGHLGYLAGHVGHDGWWWFYLACLAFKVTIGAQLLALLAAAAVAWRRPGPARAMGFWLVYPLALVLALSAGAHQGGIAFLLPAFPFAMLWCGIMTGELTRSRLGAAAVLACLVLGAVEVLAVHPDELMFFNRWAGGPSDGPRWLVHRDDWGQDDRNLAEWQRAHGVARLFFASYGSNAARWGVVGDPVPCEPTAGVYALHAVEVHRPQFSLAPGCIDWLTVEPPDARIGYSIYLYTVDAARLARLRAERATATPFWRSGPPFKSDPKDDPKTDPKTDVAFPPGVE
jgi:hypothetical protein